AHGRAIARALAADLGQGLGLRVLTEAGPALNSVAKGHPMSTNPTHDRIAKDLAENEVLLFMKGTPVFPQCGFSAAVVQVLSELGVKFKSVDVLKDPEVRQGIKEFSNWPTIPQLYVKGEFVGGCDIIKEMFEQGELEGFFKERGVPVQA